MSRKNHTFESLFPQISGSINVSEQLVEFETVFDSESLGFMVICKSRLKKTKSLHSYPHFLVSYLFWTKLASTDESIVEQTESETDEENEDAILADLTNIPPVSVYPPINIMPFDWKKEDRDYSPNFEDFSDPNAGWTPIEIGRAHVWTPVTL